MKLLFWLSIFIIFYTYALYPFLIYVIAHFCKQKVKGIYVYPTVSILMSVHNEEKNIESKIMSLLHLDYPDQRIEILVGSDGSTDKTEEIISKYASHRLKLFRVQNRQGKPNMLNILAKETKAEIIVFTDARQNLDRNCLKELVKNFADDKVGSVSAALHFEDKQNKAGNGVGLYWKYEKFIRKYESAMGSMLGATGALYAIRRELFPKLPTNLILDDVYIPMSIVQKGYRAIFDNKAKLYDRYSKNAGEEFLRKTRTLAGNFQLFMYMRWLLNPWKSPIAWQFISHKFLRLMVPFLLIAIFICNLFILHNYFYWITMVLQIIFYGLALFGSVYKHSNRLFDIPRMFCVMNSAAVAGLYKFLTKKQKVAWEQYKEQET